jgi:urease accessory protein UreF
MMKMQNVQPAWKLKHKPKAAVAVVVAVVAVVLVADKARVVVAVSAGAHQLVVAAADRAVAAGKLAAANFFKSP